MSHSGGRRTNQTRWAGRQDNSGSACRAIWATQCP